MKRMVTTSSTALRNSSLTTNEDNKVYLGVEELEMKNGNMQHMKVLTMPIVHQVWDP